MMSRSWLFFTISILLSPSVFCTDCNLPKKFQVELDNHEKLYVYDNINALNFKRENLAIYQYPGTNMVNVLINDSFITFSGLIRPNNDNNRAYQTYRVIETKVGGKAKLVNNKLTECDLYIARTTNETEFKIPKELMREILHHAAVCARANLCQDLGIVGLEEFLRAEDNPFNFGRISVLAEKDNVSEKHLNSAVSTYNNEKEVDEEEIKAFLATYPESNDVNRGALQSTINKLVDLAVAELVKKIQEENQGKIKIPDLSQKFSTGSSWWETTGEFDAFDGTFEDLTTLSRTEDAKLAHEGMKFEASCGFGLKKAFMEYPKYLLRYGIIKVNGKLSANIDGVALAAQVGVDYNQKPCRAVLDDLHVSEIGKIKVEMTGLGPLNKLLSKLVTWITKKWQEEIITKVESKLSEIIVNNLDKFDCERFRP